MPGSVSLASPDTLGGLLTVHDLGTVGLTFDDGRQQLRVGRAGDATIIIAQSRQKGRVTLELTQETLRPEEVVSNFTDEVGAEDNPVGLPGADEAYVCLNHEYFAEMEAALVARRGALIFRLKIPAGPRAAEQLARLGGMILSRYANEGASQPLRPESFTCRYCSQPFIPVAGSLDCPFCGAVNAVPVSRVTAVDGPNSIHLGIVAQMANSLTSDDLLGVGLSAKVKKPKVYDDPDAINVQCIFETHAWDGSTKTGFGVYDAAAHPDNRLERVVRNLPGRPQRIALSGADEAYLGHGKASAGICIRRGYLVFTVTVPESPGAEAQLAALADIVLERVAR